MKKKLIIAISLTIMLLIAGGCSVTANDNTDNNNKIFTIIYSDEVYDSSNYGMIYIIRDNETGEEYIVYDSGRGVGITPRLDKAEGAE